MTWIRRNWGRISHISIGIIIGAFSPLLLILVVGREALQEWEYMRKDERLSRLNRSWCDMTEWLIGAVIGAVVAGVTERIIW